MRRYLPLGVGFLLIGFGLLYYAWTQYPAWKVSQEGAFAWKNTEELQRIVLKSADGNKMELVKQQGGWKINGKYAPKADALQALLEVLQRVEYLYPVPKAAHDHVVRELLTESIVVELYTTDQQPVKKYWVGGATLDGKGTYMLLERNGKPASRPYITYIPGFRGYLTTRYQPDEAGWRSRQIFALQPEQIQEMRLIYPADSQRSFIIVQPRPGQFDLKPITESFRIADTPTHRYIRQYLGVFENIHAEAFSPDNSSKDSLKQTTPWCHFLVTDTTGKQTRLALYRMPVMKRTKSVQTDATGGEYDGDRFYFWLNDTDFGILQYYVWGKTFRKYNDFFFKP